MADLTPDQGEEQLEQLRCSLCPSLFVQKVGPPQGLVGGEQSQPKLGVTRISPDTAVILPFCSCFLYHSCKPYYCPWCLRARRTLRDPSSTCFFIPRTQWPREQEGSAGCTQEPWAKVGKPGQASWLSSRALSTGSCGFSTCHWICPHDTYLMLWWLKAPNFNQHDPGPAVLALTASLVIRVIFNSNENSWMQELRLTKAATSCISAWWFGLIKCLALIKCLFSWGVFLFFF